MRGLIIGIAALGFASSALAQQDTTRIPTGVRLSTRYQTNKRPFVAVRPPSGDPALVAVGQQVSSILTRDFDYSDRFEMVATPQALATGGDVDYTQWNSLNVVFLVTSQIAAAASGYQLSVTLHDVPFATAKQSQTFTIPAPTAANFRMAIHAISDEVV